MSFFLRAMNGSPFAMIGGIFRAPEKNNSTSCLPVGPPPAFHPPEHISICADGCALVADPHSAPYCGIIYFRDPYTFAEFPFLVDELLLHDNRDNGR